MRVRLGRVIVELVNWAYARDQVRILREIQQHVPNQLVELRDGRQIPVFELSLAELEIEHAE